MRSSNHFGNLSFESNSIRVTINLLPPIEQTFEVISTSKLWFAR